MMLFSAVLLHILWYTQYTRALSSAKALQPSETVGITSAPANKTTYLASGFFQSGYANSSRALATGLASVAGFTETLSPQAAIIFSASVGFDTTESPASNFDTRPTPVASYTVGSSPTMSVPCSSGSKCLQFYGGAGSSTIHSGGKFAIETKAAVPSNATSGGAEAQSTRSRKNCIYQLTSDMYGLGVRLGFYMQACAMIIASLLLENGTQYGRENTLIMGLSFTVAFFIGALDSPLALEFPMFMALITAVFLPALMQPFFDWPVRVCNFRKPLSYIALALTYDVNLFFAIWAVVHGWDKGPPQCDVLSGLSGKSSLSPSGHAAWLVLAGLCSLFGVFLITTMTWILLQPLVHVGSNTNTRPLWALQAGKSLVSAILMLLWVFVSMIVVVVCVVLVEMTIKDHAIDVAGLGMQEYGQWIAFVVGLSGLSGVILRLLEMTIFPRLHHIFRKPNTGSQSSSGGGSLTSAGNPAPPPRARTLTL